ncbi:hypothetical protein RHOSPDRAFT_32336 [Rhodotorula sp. JG-1b]|nr:hypothetical protein RHOSPDRAFT_32336 [Rhodotorula sp. JG-1b]
MRQNNEQHQACAACFQGYKLDGEPKGTMQELGGLAYYFAPGKSTEKAIVLGTDLFGLGVPNCKIVADWFAENTGLPVFVPDLLEGDNVRGATGDYIDPSKLGLEEFEEPMATKPFLTRMRIMAGAVWSFGFKIGPRFLARHSMGHVEPIADKFCRDLKEQKGFKILGFVGYCFGGTLSVLLAKRDSPLDACVCFHPGGPSPRAWKNIAKPFMLVCSEGESGPRIARSKDPHTRSLTSVCGFAEDFAFDRDKATVLPILAALRVPVEVWDDNKGTTHGFGCRPNMATPEVREAFERGLRRTKEWFEVHL